VFGQDRSRPSWIAAELRGTCDGCCAEAIANGVEHGVETCPAIPVDRKFGLETVGPSQLRQRDADQRDAAFCYLGPSGCEEASGDGEQYGRPV